VRVWLPGIHEDLLCRRTKRAVAAAPSMRKKPARCGWMSRCRHLAVPKQRSWPPLPVARPCGAADAIRGDSVPEAFQQTLRHTLEQYSYCRYSG